MKTKRKDPNAILDYVFDWGDQYLEAGESIISHSIIADSGITVDSSAVDGQTVVAWLSGGTNGQTYNVTCRVTTDEGRTDDWSILIWVLDK